MGLYEGPARGSVAGGFSVVMQHSEEEAKNIEDAKRAKRIILWLTALLVTAPLLAFAWTALSD